MQSTGRSRQATGAFGDLEVTGLREAYALAVEMARDRVCVDDDVERKLAKVLVSIYRREIRSIANAPEIAPEELASLCVERFTALLVSETR